MSWLLGGIFSISLFLTLAYGAPQETTPSDSKQSSLDRAPASADYYHGSFRLLEESERWLASPEAQRWTQTTLWTKLQAEIERAWTERRGRMAQVRAVLENQNVREALIFLRDLASQDMFVMVDGSLSETLTRLAVVQKQVYLLEDPSLPTEEKAELIYQWIDELLPDYHLPTIVLGARFGDTDRALNKVDEIEGLIRFGLSMQPSLSEVTKRLMRIEDARGTRIRWQLVGSEIPWDSLPTNEIFDEESMARLRELVSDKQLTLTLGMVDGYFLLAAGGDEDPWVEREPLASLSQHPNLMLLDSYQQRSLTHVTYVSDALSKSYYEIALDGFFLKNVRRVIGPAMAQLDADSELHEWLVSVIDDCNWFDSIIGELVPEARGFTSITYPTETGWEVVTQLRTEPVLLDASRPLRALQHVADPPLLLLDLRLQEHPEYFKSVRSIANRIRDRIEEFCEIESDDIPPEMRVAVRAALEFWPPLRKLADAWQERFLPSMDGEHAVMVHTGFLKSKQWHPDLPVSDVELPIPEIAILTGIRDQEQWIAGLREVRAALNDVVAIIRRLNTHAIPEEYQIPLPSRSQSDGIATYSYPIPDNCPAPTEMSPRLSIGDGWSITSYSDGQTQSIRVPSGAISIGNGLFNPSVEIGTAAYVDLGGLAHMLTPWIRYGLSTIQSDLDADLPIADGDTEIRVTLTGNDVLEFWRVLEYAGQWSSIRQFDGENGSISHAVYTKYP